MLQEVDILVLGGGGQIGRALRDVSWSAEVRIHAPTRSDVDIANRYLVDRVISSRPWACVINASGYTKVDQAEEETAQAWETNALGPAILAASTANAAIPLVHLSTDYVFGGKTTQPYEPDDPIDPLNAYGASKAAGEQAVRSANPRHIILRTSWLISPYGANFATTMLRLARQGNCLRVVDDQTGRPTSAGDAALAIQTIALRLIEGSDGPSGTYHFANAGIATWFELACEIMEAAKRRGSPPVRVEPISTSDYPTAARRPANSVLCTRSVERDFGLAPRPWQTALDDVLDALLRPRARATSVPRAS